MAERKVPINKRHRFAFRLQIWNPHGSVMLEGPSTEAGLRAMFTAAMDNSGDKAKMTEGKKHKP